MQPGYRWALVVAVVSIVAAVPGATAAQAQKPVIQDLKVDPWPIPAAGGPVTLRFHVRYASTCRLVSLGSAPFRCSGWTSVGVNWPANQSQSETASNLVIHAQGPHGRTSATWIVYQGGVPPPVVNLYTCTPGPECDYGPINASYRTWGNTAPDTLGDCSFAAAADWEQIVLHVEANESVIGYEFAQAGGTAEQGLLQNALWTYWRKDGIAGVYLTGLHTYLANRANVENGVRDYAAMIVELRFTPNDYFAQYRVQAGLHDVVVDGFTPEGPLVVSWGAPRSE